VKVPSVDFSLPGTKVQKNEKAWILADYKFVHFTLKMLLHYLVKCKKVDLRQQLVETWREF